MFNLLISIITLIYNILGSNNFVLNETKTLKSRIVYLQEFQKGKKIKDNIIDREILYNKFGQKTVCKDGSQVETYSYDENGQLKDYKTYIANVLVSTYHYEYEIGVKAIQLFDCDNNLIYVDSSYFNGKGDLLRRVFYNMEDKGFVLSSERIIEYFSSEKPSKIEEFGQNGFLERKIIYNYNTKGELKGYKDTNYLLEDTDEYSYVRNSNNNNREVKLFRFLDNKKYLIREETYDMRDSLIKLNTFYLDDNQTLKSQIFNEFDKLGRLVTKTRFNYTVILGGKIKVSREKRKYLYNSYSDLIKEEIFKDGKPIKIYTHHLDYY